MTTNIFEYSQAKPLAEAALNYRSIRQDLISSNIANVDTPMYRPKDINFEQMMAQQARQVFDNENSKELKLAQTHGYHMDKPEANYNQAAIFFRDGHMARNDGNSVDLDVETSEMSKNGVMYSALVNGLKKHGQIFKGMLEASGKLQ